MSKYLKKFATVADYNTYINGSPDLPNVSYITATGGSEVNGAAKDFIKIADYDGATSFNAKRYIETVTIPDSVTSISNGAFGECVYLTVITVDSNNSVYDSRDNCNAIIETSTNTLKAGCKTTVIPNTVTSIGNRAFYGCTGLTSIVIPDSVTSIGEYAFYNCTGLTSITIPDSVTSIGRNVFTNNTNLTSITIPDSVTSIGIQAFYNCSSLASVTVLASTPPTLGTSAFENNASGRKIYVPAESVETYKTAQFWSTYASYIYAIPTE